MIRTLRKFHGRRSTKQALVRKWMGVEVKFREHFLAFAYALPESPGLLL